MEIQKVNPGLVNITELTGASGQSNLASTPNKLSQPSKTTLSSLAEFAYSHDIQELSYNNQETRFAYYKDDNSMALRAHSVTDIHLRQDTISFDLTFSAEALGLSAKDFADSSKPMVLNFSFQKTELDISYESVTRQVKTLRKPEDILFDLSKALREVLQFQGNKSISYVLDDEARQSLMTDPKVIKLFGELVMIIAAINVQKEEMPRSDFTINISGKGKPYIDHEEKTKIEGEALTVNFSITIEPPQTGKAPEMAAETPALPPQQDQPDIQQ